LEDVARIDKDLGESLISLQEIVNKKHEIVKDPFMTPVEKSSRIKELKFKVSYLLNHTVKCLITLFIGSQHR
jgi:uncharacterized membrane protein